MVLVHMGKRGNSPLVHHWNNAGSINSNLLPDRLCQIKVLSRRVAPPAGIVRQRVVRWAVIGGCDSDRYALFAPLRGHVITACQLVALPATKPVIEQLCTQCCGTGPVSLSIQVAISTSPTYTHHKLCFQINKLKI